MGEGLVEGGLKGGDAGNQVSCYLSHLVRIGWHDIQTSAIFTRAGHKSRTSLICIRPIFAVTYTQNNSLAAY